MKGNYLFIQDKLTMLDGERDVDVITLTRVIKDINSVKDNLAILRINLYESAFSEIMRNGLNSDKGLFFLVNDKGDIVSSINKEEIGTSMQEYNLVDSDFDEKYNYFERVYNGENCLVTYYNLENDNWRLINIQEIDNIIKDAAVIKKTIIWLICICLIICQIFLSLFFI